MTVLAASTPTEIFQVIGAGAALCAIIGLVMTAWKLIRDGGAADARRQDEDKALNTKVDLHTKQLEEIQKQITPNGGDSKQLGDVVLRIETSLDALVQQFQQHLGASDQIHKEMWRAIEKAGKE